MSACRSRFRRIGAGLAAAVAVSGAPRVECRPVAGLPPWQAPAPRDPFVRLPEPSPEPRRTEARARGLPGLRVSEVEVVGILVTADARLAVLEAPDGRTCLALPDAQLADGIVREVARDAVFFSVPQGDGTGSAGVAREVRKTLGERSVRP